MTQAALAERLGVTQAAWSAIERGQRRPSFELLQRMVSVLEVSADWLLLEAPAGTSVEMPPQPRATTAVPRIPVVSAIAPGATVQKHVAAHAEEFIALRDDSEYGAAGAFFGLRVRGRSMEPWMYEGDVAICSMHEPAEVGQDVCFYRYATGQSIIGRLGALDQEAGTLRLWPLHPGFGSTTFGVEPQDEIKKVVGLWRDFSDTAQEHLQHAMQQQNGVG